MNLGVRVIRFENLSHNGDVFVGAQSSNEHRKRHRTPPHNVTAYISRDSFIHSLEKTLIRIAWV